MQCCAQAHPPNNIILQLFKLQSMCALLHAYRCSVGLSYHLVRDWRAHRANVAHERVA